MPDVKPIPVDVLQAASKKIWYLDREDAVYPSDVAAYCLALMDGMVALLGVAGMDPDGWDAAVREARRLVCMPLEVGDE